MDKMDSDRGEEQQQPQDKASLFVLVLTTLVVSTLLVSIFSLLQWLVKRHLPSWQRHKLLSLLYTLLLAVLVSLLYVQLYSGIARWLDGNLGGNYRLGSSLYDLISGIDGRKPIPTYVLSLVVTLLSGITTLWVKSLVNRYNSDGIVKWAQTCVLATVTSLSSIYMILLGASLVLDHRLPIDHYGAEQSDDKASDDSGDKADDKTT